MRRRMQHSIIFFLVRLSDLFCLRCERAVCARRDARVGRQSIALPKAIIAEEGNFFITSQFHSHKVWLTSNQSLFVLRASRERATLSLQTGNQSHLWQANPNAITIKVSFALQLMLDVHDLLLHNGHLLANSTLSVQWHQRK